MPTKVVLRRVLPLATAAWLLIPSAAPAARSCGRAGGVAVQESPSREVVILRDQNSETRDLYLACWIPSGVTRRLATVKLDSHGRPTSTVGGFNFRGGWVCWAQVSNESSGLATMRSRNVRSGKAGPVVATTADAPAGPRNGPVVQLDGPASRLVALAPNGRFAWVVTGGVKAPDGRPVDAVYVAAGHGDSRRVDYGSLGSIDAMGAVGYMAVWRRDGRRHSVSLR